MVCIILLVIGLLYFGVARTLKKSDQGKLLKIYLCCWLGVMILSTFGVYGVNIPSAYTHTLLLIHLIGYIMGALFVSANVTQKINPHLSIINIEYNINRVLKNKVFRFLLIIVVLYSAYMFRFYLNNLLFTTNMAETRTEIINIYGTFFINIAKPFFLFPMSTLCYVLFGYSIIKQRDWVCILMGIFLILNASFTGGRIGYVYILVGILFVNIFITKVNIIKYLPYIVIFTLVIYATIVSITTMRNGTLDFNTANIQEGIEETNRHAVTYLTGSQAALDYAIENNYLSVTNGYTYGTLTFYPIISFLNLFTNKFLELDIAARPLELIKFLEENWINDIGTQHDWNALYTSCIFYYIDGGSIGIFFYSLFLGVLYGLLIKTMYKSGSVLIFSLVCFVFICMLKSLLKMEIINGFTFFVIIIMYFIGTQNKIAYGNK